MGCFVPPSTISVLEQILGKKGFPGFRHWPRASDQRACERGPPTLCRRVAPLRAQRHQHDADIRNADAESEQSRERAEQGVLLCMES